MNGSPGQYAALDALIRTGSQRAAARDLGISDRALRRRLQHLRDRNDGMTTVQLAYWYRRSVWDTAA